MQCEEEISEAFRAYIKAYFQKRNQEQTLGMFHSSMTCVGTGMDETGIDTESTIDLYRRDFDQAPNPIDVEHVSIKIVPLNQNAGLVISEINISGTIMEQPFVMNGLRLSTVFIKVDNLWQLAHKHISLPTDVHETGESYPLKEIEERNRLLEKMVEEKTQELKSKNEQLEFALREIKTLSGLLPICANCKKIRDDTGYWNQIEEYIGKHSEAEFSHSICPDCIKKLYPDVASKILEKQNSDL